MATGTTDNKGNLTVQFRTPLEPLGNYIIRAIDGSGESTTATLRVIPRIMLAPESEGPTGFRFRVYLYGNSPGSRVQILWDEQPLSPPVTILIAGNGRGSKIIYVPDNARTGDHTIRANVVGVRRSATTPFRVTGPGISEEPTAAATVIPTVTATLEPTVTPTVTASPEPTATIEPTPGPTQAPPTETALPTTEPTLTQTSTLPTDTPVPELTVEPTVIVPEEKSA